jgi:Carboxypeptidase regulatory-like domain/TonB dependent receptor
MASAFRSTWTSFLLAFMVLALCVGAFAQGGAGELTGQITDSTGAVVSGVEVKLTQSATGEVRTTVTTPAGTYRFPALEIVGTYTLEITAKGFKSVKVHNIVATVGQITTRDVKLDVGAATEQVTVEAGEQLVQTGDAALSEDVDSKIWQDAPLETRSSNEFLSLVAGAEPAAVAMLGTDRGPAVNGTRSGSGNFMVDGFSNNDQGLGGGGSLVGPGGSNTTISPDAIQEYRVIDGTPPAEYGQAGGFVTDTVLKGGTNQWHGSLFEYNRVQALAANSWFSNAAGQQDHLVRNQFGGSVGGPIIKEKTFFYFTTEFHRLRTATPDTANTYTSDFYNFVQTGAFETFQETNPAGICYALFGHGCAGGLPDTGTLGAVYTKETAAEAPALCTTGAANCATPASANPNVAQGFYTGGAGEFYTGFTPAGTVPITYPVNIYGTLTVPQPQQLNQARYTTKFDHKLSSNDQLSATYLYDNADAVEQNAGSNFFFGPTLYSHGRAQNAGVTWSHTFSPTILNQARMAYVRHTANFPGDPSVSGMSEVFSYFDEPAGALGNADNIPQLFTENEFVYKDDLSVAKGKNNFKGGAEFRRTRNGSTFSSVKSGLTAFQDTEDVLTDGGFTNDLEQLMFGKSVFGALTYSEASLNPQTGDLPNYYRGYRANEFATYIQDDWRVSPRLTVNIGVRWEYFGPPHNFQPGLDANFFQGTNVTPIPLSVNPSVNPFFPRDNGEFALFATGTVEQRNHNIWSKDLHNLGPRLGFSWDALGNQKMVIRGGYGINYDRIYNNVFENIRFNPPYFALGELGTWRGEADITPALQSTLVSFPFVGTSTYLTSPLTPELRAMDQNIVTPYYEQAHFGVQYQLGKDMVVESNFVGTYGHKLAGILNHNTYDGRYAGGDSTAVNPNFSAINFRTNCCDSNYAGWQTTFRKRFSNGLQFNANYTYSKAMDDLSDAFTGKGTAGGFPTDNWDPKLDYGLADFNVKHRVVGSFVYDLPFAKSNRWLGGWNISGIVSVQSGADFSIDDSQVDSNADGYNTDRAVYLGPGGISSTINHSTSPAKGYLNASPTTWGMLNAASGVSGEGTRFSSVPCTANGGAWCNNGEMVRNTLIGPGFFNTDLGFSKSFKINERAGVKIEGNFFNILNHPNFETPSNNLAAGNFGESTATFTNQQTGGPRITQLALRFDF